MAHVAVTETKDGAVKPTQTRDISAKLLERAQSLLKSASLSASKGGKGHGDLAQAVEVLHREKTTLETAATSRMGRVEEEQEEDEEDDEEMKMLMELKKAQVKELTDSDFDTDLEEDFDSGKKLGSRNRRSWEDIYLQMCTKLGQRPIPMVLRGLRQGRSITVSNRCMNALDTLALTSALINNTSITRLSLDGNLLGDEGAICIAWLISEKGSKLQHLSLSENGISDEGMYAIGEMLSANRTITHLNLSGNCLHERNILLLAEALKDNRTLAYLNLSHNDLGDGAMRILAPGIVTNECVQYLDLSWNKIRPEGGIVLANALKENSFIRSLILRMNGLSDPGASFMADSLMKNETLIYLDLTYNRISDKGDLALAKMLEKNETLHHLILHSNPMGPKGVLSLLTAIKKNANSAIWKLDVNNIPILTSTKDLIKELQETLPAFNILHGVSFDNDALLEEHYNHLHNRNPMAVVKDYIEREGLRLIDFFKQFDRDRGGTISREEFKMGLQQGEVDMSEEQLDRLIDILDRDGNGEIDYVELVEGDKEYRRRLMKQKMEALKFVSTLQSAVK